MKLQVNNSGAWKLVLVFGIEDLDEVKSGAQRLGQLAFISDYKIGWRILDGIGHVVLHWDALKGWHVPHWAEGYTWVP